MGGVMVEPGFLAWPNWKARLSVTKIERLLAEKVWEGSIISYPDFLEISTKFPGRIMEQAVGCKSVKCGKEVWMQR